MQEKYLSQMQPTENISGIYEIIFPNGEKYIGQAQNIRARLKEHNSYAKNGHGTRPLLLCQQKMRQYKYTIDKFILLEEVKDLSQLDEREQYWISFEHSYVKEGNGYNKTRGGDASGKRGVDNPMASFSQKELDEIIDLLKNHTELSLIDIAKKYGVNQNTILKISTGKSYINPNLQYPLRRNNHDSVIKNKITDYFSSEEELISLKEDLRYRWDLSIQTDIANKYSTVPLKIIRDINIGRLFQDIGFYNYPLRRKNIRNSHNLSRQNIIDILKFLKETQLSMADIGKKYHLSRATVAKINTGERYIIKDYPYPARKIK